MVLLIVYVGRVWVAYASLYDVQYDDSGGRGCVRGRKGRCASACTVCEREDVEMAH